MTIQSTKQRTTDGVSASLHPRTGNLRFSLLKDGVGWVHFFFDDQPSAVEFLEGALDLVDPQPAGEGGPDA